MTVQDVVSYLETIAPLYFQESYDNSGLCVGDPGAGVKAILISVDVTEAIIDEAIEKGANVILSHHPVIFQGMKKITGQHYTERIVAKALKNDISLLAWHTNLDNVQQGVNAMICSKLGLQQPGILKKRQGDLLKLVTFVPIEHAGAVREAIFAAGAGHIGNYDSCSYNLVGNGTFRGDESTNPFVGEKGKLHFEEEYRVETIVPRHLKNVVLKALFQAHPYEEVAYDIYPLDNEYSGAGAGMIGTLEKAQDEEPFLRHVKDVFSVPFIKHTALRGKKIQKVAVCGGSGSFLLSAAMKGKADIFISSDIKYHHFFEADGKIVIADVGHYESEQFTRDIFYERLTEKFSTFAIYLSKRNSNPVNYF